MPLAPQHLQTTVQRAVAARNGGWAAAPHREASGFSLRGLTQGMRAQPPKPTPFARVPEVEPAALSRRAAGERPEAA